MNTDAPRRSRGNKLDVAEYRQGVRCADRAILGRAITLVESETAEAQAMAQELLGALLPHTGKAVRLGITGVPGVGKSTLIDSLGSHLTARGHRVAVLAVDPSSSVSGGSIMGDKTRMERLANDPRAFVRPSPSGGSLGGVARKTRESMFVCEAAGFDVVIVETVGVGQSETTVADMVDFFLVLMLAGAGDALQGIKRGLLELADMLAITKADGSNLRAAQRARREYEGALGLMRPLSAHWTPPVTTCSALDESASEQSGLEDLWRHVREHHRILQETGELATKRRSQQLKWMWTMVENSLIDSLRRHPQVAAQLGQMEAEVADGRVPATVGARRLLEEFFGHE